MTFCFRDCRIALLLLVVACPEVCRSEEVMLGTGNLLQGIPGTGPLTKEDLARWLSNPATHSILQPQLPAGLGAAQGGIQIPADNLMTRGKIELGRQLYFDTRLSSDNTISCASCHHPDQGYTAQTQFGVGVRGQTGNRNSPVSYNRILTTVQFWDGRAGSVEDQAKGPIQNPIEMGNTHDAAVKTVSAISGYQQQFEKIFPGEGVTIDTIAKAIATFERAVVTGTSPADLFEDVRKYEMAFAEELKDLKAFEKDDPESYAAYTKAKSALAATNFTESLRRGRELFFTKANCTACHAGANFTDEKYHNIGVGMEAKNFDSGRYEVTKVDADRGAFKTPTLRNVALTAPYMHDGSQKTLEEVVDWYDKGGHPNPYLSDKIKKLNLTAMEKADLVVYMKGLTGPFPKVEQGRLP